MTLRTLVVAPLAFALLLAGCAPVGRDSTPSTPTAVESDAEGVPRDPISQMEIAFEDYPTQGEITSALDEAFVAIGLDKTDENYSRAGSALVALQDENGGTEMETLRCIPSMVGDSRLPEDSFANLAALCSLVTTGQLSQLP